MPEPNIEKRATRRFLLQLPIALQSNGDSVHLHTRDVSASGVCFHSNSRLTEGQDINFTMTLPPEITLTEPISVRCTGRVVRVEKCNITNDVSVAAIIDRYEFLGRS